MIWNAAELAIVVLERLVVEPLLLPVSYYREVFERVRGLEPPDRARLGWGWGCPISRGRPIGSASIWGSPSAGSYGSRTPSRSWPSGWGADPSRSVLRQLQSELPVLRLRVPPDSAYLAPTEAIFHDESTSTASTVSLTFTLAGSFAVNCRRHPPP